MHPLPMAASCALDEAGLRSQIERYRRAGQRARLLERSSRLLVAELDRQVDSGLVEKTVAIERGCCPWLTLDWQPARRRLSISVSQAAHEPALEALAFALGLETPAPQTPTG